MANPRPVPATVRALTAADVAAVMRKFGYYFSESDHGTARAIADALNDRLASRGDK